MPKSKPPRRRRALRHVGRPERRALCFYDLLEQEMGRILKQAEPCLADAPAQERVIFHKQVADFRQTIDEGRADLRRPSMTPVLDRLIAERQQRRLYTNGS